MGHFCRILFYLTAAASGLVFLACVILWPLSYHRWDCIRCGTAARQEFGLTSGMGRCVFFEDQGLLWPPGFSHDSDPVSAEDTWSYGDRSRDAGDIHEYKFLGCEYAVVPPRPDGFHAHWIFIPYSYPTALSALASALCLVSWQRRRRRNRLGPGLCATCGYDLRGHAAIPHARCPECGTPASRA